MLLRLLILFTVVPLLELALLFKLSELTSAKWTFGLILVTGFVGAALARHQGFTTWRKIQTELSTGNMPGGALVDGLLILIAGAVLLTPGMITDAVGFALLIPPIRTLVKKRLVARFKSRTTVHFQNMHSPDAGFATDEDKSTNDPNVIDVEFTRQSSEDP